MSPSTRYEDTPTDMSSEQRQIKDLLAINDMLNVSLNAAMSDLDQMEALIKEGVSISTQKTKQAKDIIAEDATFLAGIVATVADCRGKVDPETILTDILEAIAMYMKVRAGSDKDLHARLTGWKRQLEQEYES